MGFELFISKIAGIILLPPGLNLVLFIASFWLLKLGRKKMANGLMITSIVSLYLLSTPLISDSLQQNLQTIPALSQEQVRQIVRSQSDEMAIVILAGGRISLAPEYGSVDIVSAMTLQRIHYAAWLHRKTGLPMLVSGGSVYGEPTAESVLMNQTMLSAFNIAPKWIETQSRNTAENAQYTSQMLARNGIKKILLVTHGNHMQRALQEFSLYNLEVIAAPTVFKNSKTTWRDYFPSAKGLLDSQQAIHEEIGQLWSSLRRGN